MTLQDLTQPRDEARHGISFQPPGGAVGQQHGLAVKNCAHLDQPVGAQRLARLHEIDDQIGQIDQRRQFNRPAEFDDLCADTATTEERLGQPRKLGGDARVRLQTQRAVAARSRCGHRQPAISERQQQRLQHISLGFAHHIQPRDTEIRCPVFHIDGHIGRLGQHVAHMLGHRAQHQLPVTVARRQPVSGLLQQRQRIIRQTALGQSNDQLVLDLKLSARVV